MRGQPVVLVVDDQAPNRKLLADLLATKGYAVETAESGDEALARLQDIKPDLVLLDVVMPGLSGYDVCRAIRADPVTGTLPVVMVTALDPAQERVRGLDAGADDFLTKPINTPALARVKSLLRIKTFRHGTARQRSSPAQRRPGTACPGATRRAASLAQLKRFFPPHLAERIVAGDVDIPSRPTGARSPSSYSLDLPRLPTPRARGGRECCAAIAGDGATRPAYGGTLEQFSGGSILIIFNDPVIVEAASCCSNAGDADTSPS
jgi:CheY-like chemotaxis protein